MDNTENYKNKIDKEILSSVMNDYEFFVDWITVSKKEDLPEDFVGGERYYMIHSDDGGLTWIMSIQNYVFGPDFSNNRIYKLFQKQKVHNSNLSPYQLFTIDTQNLSRQTQENSFGSPTPQPEPKISGPTGSNDLQPKK